MLEIDWRVLAALFVAALVVCLGLLRRWAAWRRSAVARVRGARAVQGEHDAEALLEAEGYTILERQLRKVWTLLCDDEPTDFDLRADLLVEREGQQFIAEVKTGQKAPDLRNAATRRQILEYAVAFNSATILLVDVEQGLVHEVEFDLLRNADCPTQEVGQKRVS